MDIHAFIDKGYAQGKEFSEKFLSSKEFILPTLQLIASGTSHLKKQILAEYIADVLDKNRITPEQVLLEYVKQPRMWLSLKLGLCANLPVLNPSASLLTVWYRRLVWTYSGTKSTQ